MINDQFYMNIACSILERSIGSSFPNPTVICLIVESDKEFKKNEIVSFGITNKSGRPHAESIAINKTKFIDNKYYTLYSTLEPCCHQGRGESCVKKINETIIKRVVYSLKDPDRRVNGKGEKILKKNGIQVVSGVLKNITSKLYSGYILNKKYGRPKITLKIACSLDGKISSHKGVRSKITNVLSNKIVHLIRSQHDAILIGSNTLRVDNPKLNCRLSGLEKQSPLRVILASKLNFNDDLEILKNCTAQKTIFFTKETNQRKISFFTKKGVEVITFTKKRFNLETILKKLASLNIYNLLVEGGSKIFSSFLLEGFCDQILLFQSNFFIGEQGETILKSKNPDLIKKKFKLKKVTNLDNNILSILET